LTGSLSSGQYSPPSLRAERSNPDGSAESAGLLRRFAPRNDVNERQSAPSSEITSGLGGCGRNNNKQGDMAKDTTGRLHVTVKTGGKRKLSSKLWLERQLNDPYVARAKREGFRSRAAFKLVEIDDKYHFLKPGMTVVDLGAAPGGWSQVAAKRVGAAEGKGRVLAIDLLEMPEIVGVTFAKLDFLEPDAPERLNEMMKGRADVVMSDMAANTTGHRKTDQLRMVGLVEAAAAFAAGVLKPGGTFLAKTFQSGADAELMAQLKRDYATVRHVKPSASRQDSSERYLLATGFRGGK
jgi:23S rRNA (uridine2552-2'-O)-methyltransferase